MPWKNTNHTEEIIRFVMLARSGRFNITDLCEQFGISRKTGYKNRSERVRLWVLGLTEREEESRRGGMARKPRLESEGGLYHVINRGNYRGDIFRSEKAREAFLTCLGQACEKSGWRVHAWCIMRNHYHLALETPRGNLVAGMQWLQGTFSKRFNRLRKETGHLFQGRYKSLHVEPGEGLGALCHYIHLNPVRAKVCKVEALREWPWSSFHWLMNSKKRPHWYDPAVALSAAGKLADTAVGLRKYTEYLAWLAENKPEQKKLRFEDMSTGWAIGTTGFKQALLKDHGDLLDNAGAGTDREEARKAQWQGMLDAMLHALGKTTAALGEGKSVAWKLAIAAELKRRSTVTNRWLSETMRMGNLYEVSRKIAAWQREPDRKLQSKLIKTPNPKV